MMLPPYTRPAEDPRHGPVILRSELLEQGLDDRAIARRIKRGALVRIRHGAYTTGANFALLDAEGLLALRGRAVLRQARATSVLSHTSALCEYAGPLWGFDLSVVHTTRTDGLTGRHHRDVFQHCGTVRLQDIVRVNGVPVMGAARTALEVTTLGNTEAALCAVNFMLHAELTTFNDLTRQLVEMEAWPQTLTTDLVLRLADPRIESVGESRTFWCCWQQGLPRPEIQHEIKDANGHTVARVDFAWPEYGVYLEFDGMVKYEKLLGPGERASDVVVREKRRESLIQRLTGWRCIRVTWADLACPERLGALIRDALFVRRAS